MIVTKKYTDTEKQILALESNMSEISDHEIEEFASDLETHKKMWYALELGRHPSTDMRTYTLHTWFNKPEFDYYGATKVKLKKGKK